MRLTLKKARGAKSVDIAVDVKLQQISRRVSRPTSVSRISARKAKLEEIEIINESLDEADRVISGDVVINGLREEQNVRAGSAFNKGQWIISWNSYANICYYDYNGV